MSHRIQEFILNLRLQYYIPFTMVAGYVLLYPPTERVDADQGQEPAPILQSSEPHSWPELPVLADPEKITDWDPSDIELPPAPVAQTQSTPQIVPAPPSPIDFSAPVSPLGPQKSPELKAPDSPNSISPVPKSLPEEASQETVRSSDEADSDAGTTKKRPVTKRTKYGRPVIENVDLGNDQVSDDSEESNSPSPVTEINVPPIVNPYKPDDYRLTIGDTIEIFIANIPEFTTKNIVTSDGLVNLPVAGPLYLWDMTVEEASRAVYQHYVEADVLRNPDVAVRLLASSPLKVAIAGEINRPGAYDVPVLDKKLPTITDAIKAAGGIATEADLKNVELYRHNRQGGQDLISLNLWDLFQKADLSQNITLRSGDRIIIPTSPIKPDEAQLMAAANISPDTMQIGILGEVLSPGLIQSPTNTALNQALILVGGLSPRAKKSVQLIRTDEDGTVTRKKIKIDWSANVGDERNPVLHHRDVVLVGPNAITRYSDFLDRAIGPINRTVPFIGILDLLFPGRTGSR